jgi:hypothetical protein
LFACEIASSLRSDLVFVQSDFDKMILSDYVPSSSLICLPTPIEDYDISRSLKELYRIDLNKKSLRNLAFAGDFSEPCDQQNLRYLLDELWPEIKQRHPSIKLDILGDKINRQILEMCQNSKDVRAVVE